jgi:hypothetical protein
VENSERQDIVDDEHLKMLSIGYLVSGVMSIFMSLIGLFYMAMGAMFAFMPEAAKGTDGPPPAMFLMLFGGFGLVMFVLLLGLGLAKFRVASLLKKRQSKTFCMVIAGISCLGIPWGTVLGVCTFMVLGRDSVTRQFDAPAGVRLSGD